METMEQKTQRNCRVQARYDELMREGKHGHYETMFRVVREEVERKETEVNRAMRQALTSAEDPGEPTAGSSREWDDGYVNGIKACAAVVQVAMRRAG